MPLLYGVGWGNGENNGAVFATCPCKIASPSARLALPASTYTRQGWELKLLGDARATSRISTNRDRGTGSGRNARTGLRERTTSSSSDCKGRVEDFGQLTY